MEFIEKIKSIKSIKSISGIKGLFVDKEVMAKSQAMQSIKSEAFNASNAFNALNVQETIGNYYTLKNTGACLVGSDVMADVEIINAFNAVNTVNAVNENATTVFSSLDGCSFSGSRALLKDIMVHPSSDKDLLLSRQATVNSIEEDLNDAKALLADMKSHETDILWMFKSQTDEMSMLIDIVYFKFIMLQPLNGQANALTALNLYKIIGSPLIGILSPIVYFVIPFLVMRVKFGIKVNFIDYLKMMMNTVLNGNGSNNLFGSSKLSYISFAFSFVFYFQSLFNNVEVAKVVYNISEYITNKMVNVIKFTKAANKLIKLLSHVDVTPFVDLTMTPIEEQNAISSITSFNALNDAPFSPISNFGVYLKAFKSFDKVQFKTLLSRVYALDAIVSIQKIKVDHGFTDVVFIDQDKPSLNVMSIWHPCLSADKIIKNDLVFDKSIIITGPNAGGKSTMIKSILIAIIMAQTIGIANATELTMTPFYYISSQMNIPDCKGKESLFEAEMFRSKKNLDVLKGLNGEKKSVIFMDEIFNSTNPVEGIAGAFAIAKNMASYAQNLSIITTHYLYLTKLAKIKSVENVENVENVETPVFKNVKMNIKYDKDGNIVYPYKLTNGVSKQFIAIEILQKNGFDPDIVKDALEIKKSLLA